MRIPIITTDINYPVVRPGDVSSGFRAQAEMGQDVQSLINTIAQGNIDIRNKFKQADDLIITSQKKNEYVMFAEEQSNKLDVDPDVNNRFDKWMLETQRKRVELLSSIKDDLLRKRVEAELSQTTLGLMINEKNKRFIQKVEIQSADADKTMMELANIGDVNKAKEISKKMVDIGVWKPPDKLAKDNAVEETAEKSNIVLRVNSGNIKMLQSFIDDLDKGMYKKISPLERSNYRVLAEKNIEAIKDKNKTVEDEATITNAIRSLKNEWPNSPDMQNIMVTNSQWQESHGLDSKLAHTAQIRLKGEQDLLEEAKRKIYADTHRKWFLKLDSLTFKEINDDVRLDKASTEMGEEYRNRIISPPEVKDDPEEYFRIQDAIMKPDLNDEEKSIIRNNILKSNKLSIQTKKTLGNELYSPEDDRLFKDPWFKFAVSSVKESLGWTEQLGWFQLKDPTKGMSSYRDIIRQLIIDIKKDNLKGEEIDKRARQLSLGPQMEIWNMLMGGKKEEKPKEKEKYNVGQTYPDAQGRKAKYLGAGKWETVQ